MESPNIVRSCVGRGPQGAVAKNLISEPSVKAWATIDEAGITPLPSITHQSHICFPKISTPSPAMNPCPLLLINHPCRFQTSTVLAGIRQGLHTITCLANCCITGPCPAAFSSTCLLLSRSSSSASAHAFVPLSYRRTLYATILLHCHAIQATGIEDGL